MSDVDLFVNSIQVMSILSSHLTGEEDISTFMHKLLMSALKSIPEAEAGSVWILDENEVYKPVSSHPYPIDGLKKMSTTQKNAFIFKKQFNDDVMEIQKISDFAYDRNILLKIYKDLNLNPEKIVTIVSPLKVSGKIIGHIYIDNFRLRNFPEVSKKLLKIFSNFASTFLTLKFLRDSERKANEMKDMYISFFSHELRTPITTIMGYSENILRDKDLSKEEIQNIARKIYSASKHLKLLIENISTFVKLQKETKLELKETNLRKLVYESVAIIEPNISDEVELNISLKDAPEKIVTDPLKLKQILINIIGNSAKYTEKGSIDVKVYKEGNFVIFKIADTGPGIPKDKLKDIFKPFYRISKEKSGSGLGLAIVDILVKQLKGKISVKSELGKGTEFVIQIPLNT